MRTLFFKPALTRINFLAVPLWFPKCMARPGLQVDLCELVFNRRNRVFPNAQVKIGAADHTFGASFNSLDAARAPQQA